MWVGSRPECETHCDYKARPDIFDEECDLCAQACFSGSTYQAEGVTKTCFDCSGKMMWNGTVDCFKSQCAHNCGFMVRGHPGINGSALPIEPGGLFNSPAFSQMTMSGVCFEVQGTSFHFQSVRQDAEAVALEGGGSYVILAVIRARRNATRPWCIRRTASCIGFNLCSETNTWV